jgi:hypothetical protein
MIKDELVEPLDEFKKRMLRESQTPINVIKIKTEKLALEVKCQSAEEIKDAAIAKNVELSAQLERVSGELEIKKREIAIYVKKHAKIQQVETEILALEEKNSAFQRENGSLKAEIATQSASNIKKEPLVIVKSEPSEKSSTDYFELQSALDKGRFLNIFCQKMC